MKREWTKVFQLRDRVFVVLGPSRFAASFPAGELGVEDSRVYFITGDICHISVQLFIHDAKIQVNRFLRRCPDR